MMAMGILLIGLGLYFVMSDDFKFFPWIGLSLLPGLILRPSVVGLLAVLSGPVIYWAQSQKRPSARKIRQNREQIVRWWRAVSVFLSAGLTFWQAVEEGLQQVPELADEVRDMAMALAMTGREKESLNEFCRNHPGPEAEIVGGMMAHGFRHGLDPYSVTQQVEQMEERLAFERELKKQGDPLWMTILPAILLMNVIAVLFVPMMVLMMQNWKGL